jgi:alkanesulfonate monooxygenase SsuD/methylene tetrahydromethanopterin reductase-like flavin-dependent oxidoreductase (luciferase family)
MLFGIHLPHAGERATPALIRRFAIQAEALGFADVWVSEHIILPRTQFPRKLPFYEPVVTLTWVAAVTERVRLGTSVLVLPMRHPIPLAKELATLQNLSNGRLNPGRGRRLARTRVRRPRRPVPRARPPDGRRHRILGLSWRTSQHP